MTQIPHSITRKDCQAAQYGLMLLWKGKVPITNWGNQSIQCSHLQRFPEDGLSVARHCFTAGLPRHGRKHSVPDLRCAAAADGHVVPVQRRIHPPPQSRIP